MNQEESCPGCASPCKDVTSRYPVLETNNVLEFSGIAECAVCHLAFASPMPTQERLDRFYADGAYWHDQVQPTKLLHLHGLAQGIARADWCARLIGARSLVVADVGAGYGWQANGLARVFGRAVSRFTFIEPDDQAAAAIESRSLPFRCQRIDSLPADSGYDLIFLNQVLEHVARPVDFLAKAKASLYPGGYLYVETPHRDDRFKSDVFPHTLFFSREAMTNSILSAKLELLAIEEFGRMPTERAPLDLALRVAFRLAVTCGWTSMAVFLDSMMWRYKSRALGIWLRALARRPA